MRILPFAALALVCLAPVAQAQNTTTRSAADALLTLDEAINLARRNNPVYLSQATSRRTADAAVRSARGAMLPSADASFGTRYQQGGQQVFNGLSFSNSSDVVQSSYGLNLNYRVNTATFVNPKAAVANRDAVDADISGSGEQLRSEEHTSELQSRLHLVCR